MRTPTLDTYCAVDIETTGLQVWHDDVIEIAAVRFRSGKPTGESFVSLARSRVPIPRDATAIHGLRDEDVADAPEISDVVRAFAEFVRGQTLVVHNAPFDLPFLARELWCARVDLKCPVIDTVRVSRSVSPRGSHSLGPACARNGIRIRGRHRGGGDAEAAGRLLWALLSRRSGDPTKALGRWADHVLEPLRTDDLPHLRDVVPMLEACRPGSKVWIVYRSPQSPEPTECTLTVEFYSRSGNHLYLTGRKDASVPERRCYRLDRVEAWAPAPLLK